VRDVVGAANKASGDLGETRRYPSRRTRPLVVKPRLWAALDLTKLTSLPQGRSASMQARYASTAD
jgi:hypothetical protein